MHKAETERKIYLIGAGGHTRSLINILELNGFRIAGIYDDIFNNSEAINGYKLIGKLENIKIDDVLVLSTGDSIKRRRLFRQYYRQICKENIVHPSATVEQRVAIGQSNQFFAVVYINSNVVIGNNNILNTGSILEHEVLVGDHNHISVGVVVCGRVTVGNECFIGAGTVVIDKVKICDDVIIGANSVVINDINEPGTYVGNPARKIK